MFSLLTTIFVIGFGFHYEINKSELAVCYDILRPRKSLKINAVEL